MLPFFRMVSFVKCKACGGLDVVIEEERFQNRSRVFERGCIVRVLKCNKCGYNWSVKV